MGKLQSIPELIDLSGKHGIVTGGLKGIGQAITRRLVECGAKVLIADSDPSIDDCSDTELMAFQYCDVTNAADLASAITSAANDQGIDFIVNNAGMGYTNPLRETSLTDWQRVLDLNLTSVFQCVQGVLPYMRKHMKGTIVNISSIAATNVFSNWGAYSVSKAALLSFSKILAEEERSKGIRVTTIIPGAVNTPIWDTITVQEDFERTAMLSPDLVAQTILQVALLPIEANIEEITILPSSGNF